MNQVTTIKIGLVDGVSAHPRDAEIMRALDKATKKLRGKGPDTVAVKNEHGQIYRYLQVHGFSQFVSFSDDLLDLDFEDESERPRYRKPKGVFAVFAPCS